MRILIAPPGSDERAHVYPDIGLGYLAALARDAGHEVRFVDCLRDHVSMDDWERLVSEYRPDVVGLKAYSADLRPLEEMLRRVKAVSENAVTVIGGPHPSMVSAEVVFSQFPSLDFAVAGDGEPGWVPFLEQIESGRRDFSAIPGLAWKEGDGTVHANGKGYVEDLDTVPFPAWDLLDARRYRWGFSFMTSKYPVVSMVTTRGCPYLCTFCASHLVTGRKVRRRSVDNVIEEIKMLKKDFGIRSIDFVDENFVFYRPFVVELCERLLSENIEIAWNCPYGVRLDRVDEEMMVLMERAGCFGLSLGAESGSNRILKKIKKVLTVEQIREKVLMIRRVTNMKLQGFFMLGFPDETREEIEATIDLAVSLPFDFAVFTALLPIPGTEIYSELVETNVLSADSPYDPDGMGQRYFVRSYSQISDEELKKLYHEAYRRFYCRPKVILNLLSQIRTMGQVRTLVTAGYRVLSKPKFRADPRRRIPQRENA